MANTANEKVTYGGGFGGNRGRGGAMFPIGRSARWGDLQLVVPAVYRCGRGLVVDLCFAAEPESVRSFAARCAAAEAQGKLSREEQMRLEYEHPLQRDFTAVLTVNGKTLRQEQSCSTVYIPAELLPRPELPECDNDGDSLVPPPPGKAELLLRRYGLDLSLPWTIHRCSFPWATRRAPQLKRLSLQLIEQPQPLPAVRFSTEAVGDTVRFTHPLLGSEHTLTVREYRQEELPQHAFAEPDTEYPTRFISMTCALSPDLPGRRFTLCDRSEGDRPRRKTPREPFRPEAQDAAAVGIIGGADGPTAILLPDGNTEGLHAACSALTFAPRTRVEWLGAVREKHTEDLNLQLL